MLDKNLLDLLVCPESKQKLRLLSEEELGALNLRIREGNCALQSGSKLDVELEAVLLREDGRFGFQVRDNIPVMLFEEAILMS